MEQKLSSIQNWESLARESLWSVKALAVNCQVSPRTLQRFWKKHRRGYLIEWLEEQRFAYACMLLQNPNVKIASIAKAIAYSHLSAFSHAFRAYFGISPSRWRDKVTAANVGGSLHPRRNDRLLPSMVSVASSQVLNLAEG